MRKGYASLAVVGVAACVAVYALNAYAPQGTRFHQLTENDLEYMQFITKYGKSYGTKEEFEFRYNQYLAAKEYINAENSQNGITYTLGVNQFSDWTPEEYKKLLGYKKQPEALRQAVLKDLPLEGVPTSIDWRQKGAVNAVKNQGQCGSCWAFSSVAAIEGHHQIATGQLLSLSEQQLVDCAGGIYRNQGCNGGDMSAAFRYAEKTGLELESVYPYKGVDGTCQVQSTKELVKVTTYATVTPKSSSQLKAAIAQGPVSVAIEADTMTFQYYSGGVLNSSKCGTNLDHGVVAVGYGSENGQEYYIIRNSWGASWGEQGYVRLAITDGAGICGVQMEPVWPTTN
jgi:KDEL-tailed cysteine endopeptidase